MFKVFFNSYTKKYTSISRNDANILDYECNPDCEEVCSGTKKECDNYLASYSED